MEKPDRNERGQVIRIDNRALIDDAFPDEVRQGCFLLWWQRCGRNLSAVVRLLEDGDEDALALCGLNAGDRIPDRRTVGKWMRGSLWDIKAMNLMQEGMGEHLKAAAVTLMFGSYRAAQVVMELVDKPNPTKEDKVRLEAAKLVLDKSAGQNIEKLARGAMSKAIDPKSLKTPEEIRAFELEMLRDGA